MRYRKPNLTLGNVSAGKKEKRKEKKEKKKKKKRKKREKNMINSGFASTYLYRLIRQTRHATVAGDVTGVMTSVCRGLFNHSFLVHTSDSAQALELHLRDVRNTLGDSNDTRSAIQ